MTQHCATVALFADHLQTEAGVRALQQGGFDLKKLSIIGKNYHREEHVTGVIDRGDGARYWGRFGALWSRLDGVLGSSALLLFPGVGQVVILGPLVSHVAGGLAGADKAALAGTFSLLGLPAPAVQRYERAVRAGRFALIAHGPQHDVQVAYRLLESARAVELHEHTEGDPVFLPAAQGAA
jgi:hypothetical protein